MSSMLLRPKSFCPLKSRPPKRLVTLTMGFPSVFHTAPPQPASKARITCSPVFVGGAEASQKGFGLLIPAQSVVRSATVCLLRFGLAPLPGRHHRLRRVPPVGDRIHDLLAAVDAIPA